MFSMAPNIVLAPNMTQNAERKHRTQNTNTAHIRLHFHVFFEAYGKVYLHKLWIYSPTQSVEIHNKLRHKMVTLNLQNIVVTCVFIDRSPWTPLFIAFVDHVSQTSEGKILSRSNCS